MSEKNYFELLTRCLERHAFAQFCGFKLEQASCGKVQLGLDADDRHMNSNGAIHGGCLVSIAGVAARMAARSTGAIARIGSISTDFIANVRLGEHITIKADTLHRGKATQVVEVSVFSDAGKLLCRSLVSLGIAALDPEFPREW